MTARPCCSPPSTWRRPTGWPTASPCWTAVASSRRAPRPTSSPARAARSSRCTTATGRCIAELPIDGTIEGLQRAIDQLRGDHADASVTVRRPTLDDAFLVLTGAHTEDTTESTKEDA